MVSEPGVEIDWTWIRRLELKCCLRGLIKIRLVRGAIMEKACRSVVEQPTSQGKVQGSTASMSSFQRVSKARC